MKLLIHSQTSTMQFHPTLHWAWDYVAILGLKLPHVSKMGHWSFLRGWIIGAFSISWRNLTVQVCVVCIVIYMNDTHRVSCSINILLFGSIASQESKIWDDIYGLKVLPMVSLVFLALYKIPCYIVQFIYRDECAIDSLLPYICLPTVLIARPGAQALTFCLHCWWYMFRLK